MISTREAHALPGAKVRSRILLALLAVFCAAGRVFPEGAEPSADSILKKVDEAYSRLGSYQLVAVKTFVVSMGEANQSTESQISLAVVKPGKVRLAVKDPQRNPEEIIQVSDGRTTWTYAPKRKQYTQEEAAASTEAQQADSDEEADILTEMQNLLISRYRDLGQYSADATVARDERIKIGKEKIDCYVVKIKLNDRTHELWIDKDRFLVLRHREESVVKQGGLLASLQTTLNVKISVDPPPDSSLFEFSPPGQATRVEALNLPGERVNLTGRTAADFTLKDLQGTKLTLSDLHGKVVLLDFWATWCPPCREELPTIDKISHDYKDKSVVILGVNDEDTGTVKSFLKKNNYSFITLTDSKEEAHKAYGIRAIPTVIVIDRKGVVAAHYVGPRSEEELIAALKAAGL